MEKTEKPVAEWRPVSELRIVEKDISGYGYYKAIDDSLESEEEQWCSYYSSGQVILSESLEVKEENGTVYFRENSHHLYRDIPETFQTQFGTLYNYNNGEFVSWLGKKDYRNIAEGEPYFCCSCPDDEAIKGHFCDVFDCGNYSFAVSNLMHFGAGRFRIVRIDKDFNGINLFDTSDYCEGTALEYHGYFRNETGFAVLASGTIKAATGCSKKRKTQDRIFLFQICGDGSCTIKKEWKGILSSSNSMAALGDFVYLGQNKMVTCLNIETGESVYFTNKKEEDLAALHEIVWK